jgi:hypothetical protein
MSVRVAYVTCDTPAWFEIAQRMQLRQGWLPVYWIAEPAMRERLLQLFPGIIVHARHDAYHMVNPPELDRMAIQPLDARLLAEVAEEQVIALKMMDVVDSVDAFDFNERRRFFRQRLRYWRSVLLELRPDVAVFGFSAHVVYDYAIYTWCRRMGIRTLMFEATFNFALLFSEEDPMVGSTEIAERYNDLVQAGAYRSVALEPEYETYLSSLTGSYSTAMPWYMRDQFKSFPAQMAARLFRGELADQSGPPKGPQWQSGRRSVLQRIRTWRCGSSQDGKVT